MRKLLLITLVICFYACTKEKIVEVEKIVTENDSETPRMILSHEEVSLKRGEDVKMSCQSEEWVKYAIKNNLVASINSDTIVTGQIIGETEIEFSVKGLTESVKVKVEPWITDVELPEFLWDASYDEIVEKYGQDYLVAAGAPVDPNRIMHNDGQFGTLEVWYSFKDDKLISFEVFYKLDKKDNLIKYLDERYQKIGNEYVDLKEETRASVYSSKYFSILFSKK